MTDKKSAERVTISLEPELLEQFDLFLDEKGYGNRSEGMRDAVRQLLAQDRVDASEETACVGCVTYVYDHRERQLSNRLMEAQHHHHNIPAATLHLHIDANNCLEATVLNGTVKEVRHVANHITSQTGVKNGHLHIIPVEPEDG
ncbi:nickel-responsive transcriptional regulator NikR [Magnetovibrio sp. PR-2]|uniref:nickel-responsive transcriptional regulator NikR n=1 Tax=Magnetovibrio sp. PR-2 TaxID=3120356 RepID=UPI002FCE4047